MRKSLCLDKKLLISHKLFCFTLYLALLTDDQMMLHDGPDLKDENENVFTW